MTLDDALRLPLGEILRRLDTADTIPREAPTNTPERLLAIDETVALTCLSKDSLYRKRWPFARRVGRRVLFSASGISEWIREGCPDA